MSLLLFRNGTLVLADRLMEGGELQVEGGRITAVREQSTAPAGATVMAPAGGALAPGLVDRHVHGGAGADFMDGPADAFRTACRAHARHGTTSLLPTTTVARHERHLAFLDLCRRFQNEDTGGARVLGAHFYGPYFALEARGCHPGAPVRPPEPAEYAAYL